LLQAPAQSMGWSCVHCTLINQDHEEVCDGCGSSKEGPQPRGLRAGLKNAVSGAVSALNTIWDDVVDAAKDVSAPFAPPPPSAPQPQPYSVFNMPEVPRHGPSVTPLSPQIPVVTLSDTPPPRPPPPRRVKEVKEMPRTPVSRAASVSIHSSPMKDQTVRDEKEARNQLKEIQLLCKEFKTCFIDDEFQPNERSLGKLYDDEERAVPGRLHASQVMWLRPTEMYTKDGHRYPWTVFNDPSSSDIEQGSLGDCWLLSALALIAERPDVLEKIFLTKEYNAMGVYQVRLCVDGHWRVITVDDYFPCRKNTRSFAFAVGRKNQLWVPLVEKAYAKALGKYEMLRSGRTVEGLALLTGAPCESITLEEDDLDVDLVWARLLSAKEAGYVMGASCGAGSKKRVGEGVSAALGLLTQHAYSILDVRQEGQHRLLRVRNPWGSHVWTGAWSDNWNGWPADLKRRLLPSGSRSPGTFWMLFDDFRLHFDSLDFAKIRQHLAWAELRVPCRIGGSWADDAVALMLVVEEPTEMCCSLFRGGSRAANDHEDLLIMVHHVDPKGHVGELETRSGRSLSHMASTGDFFLRAGHYVILALSLSSFNRGAFRLHASLVVHSNKLLFGETIACPPQMATDSLVQMTLKEGTVQKPKLSSLQSLNAVIPRFVTKNFGGLLAMVDNHMPDSYVHVSADCSGSSNVLSSRGALKVIDSVPPMSRQIIIILSHFDASNGYVVQNSLWMQTSRTAAINRMIGGEIAAAAAAKTRPVLQIEHQPPFDSEASKQLHAPRSAFI
ncbi:hypothetical protein PFISCL1PPCAC_754, partial [Pristionchus fissidentatus]